MIDLNDFDVLCENRKVSHVKINKINNTVEVTNYTNNVIENPFAILPCDIHYVDDFISSRCFEEGNALKDFFLEDLGLSSYNPWDIVPLTHGVMWEDFIWVRFKGQENLTWEDVRHVRN